MIQSTKNYNLTVLMKTTLILVWEFPKTYNFQTFQIKGHLLNKQLAVIYRRVHRPKIFGLQIQSVFNLNKDLIIPKGPNRTTHKAIAKSVYNKIFLVNIDITPLSSQVTFQINNTNMEKIESPEKSSESEEFVIDDTTDEDYEPDKNPGSPKKSKRMTRSSKDRPNTLIKETEDDNSTDDDTDHGKEKKHGKVKRKVKRTERKQNAPKPAMRKSVAKRKSLEAKTVNTVVDKDEDPTNSDSSSNSCLLQIYTPMPRNSIPEEYAKLRHLSGVEDLQDGSIVKVVRNTGVGYRIIKLTGQVDQTNKAIFDDFDDEATERMKSQIMMKKVVDIGKDDICSAEGKFRKKKEASSDSSHDSDIKIVSDGNSDADYNDNVCSEDDIAYNDAQNKIKQEVNEDDDFAAAVAKGNWARQQKAKLVHQPTTTAEDAPGQVDDDAADEQEEGDEVAAASAGMDDEEDARGDKNEVASEEVDDDEAAGSSYRVDDEMHKAASEGEWMVKMESDPFDSKDEDEEQTVNNDDKSVDESDSDDTVAISTPEEDSNDNI